MASPASAEQTLVVPPQGRIYTRWTTDDLEVAESFANTGSLQRAADLCWALLGDGRVRAALETRCKGLLRLPLEWEENGDKRSAGRVVKALKGGDFARAHSEAALYSLTAWGTLLGVGIAQRVWTLHDSRWLGIVQPYDARNLRWDTQKRQWFVRTNKGEVPIAQGDRRWILYAPTCAQWPSGDEKPWLMGAWRACAKAWLGKHFAWTDWQHHSEVHGSPIRTAEMSETNPPNDARRRELANDLGSMGSNTAVIPPPGVKKLALLEATADTWEMFPEAIKTAATEVVIAITGQSSSTELQDGQRTGATLHKLVRQDLIDGDAQTLSTCLHEQSLRDYTALNFSASELTPWPAYKTEPPLDLKARGDAMVAIAAGIAALDAVAPEGKRVDRQSVFEGANVPLENAPEPPPTPAPTQPPAQPQQDQQP